MKYTNYKKQPYEPKMTFQDFWCLHSKIGQRVAVFTHITKKKKEDLQYQLL